MLKYKNELNSIWGLNFSLWASPPPQVHACLYVSVPNYSIYTTPNLKLPLRPIPDEAKITTASRYHFSTGDESSVYRIPDWMRHLSIFTAAGLQHRLHPTHAMHATQAYFLTQLTHTTQRPKRKNRSDVYACFG